MSQDPSSSGKAATIDPHVLMRAYASGIFPMADEDGKLAWFSPDPRGVLPLDRFHIPKGLRRVLRKNPFQIRVNTAFESVIDGCADREETWIDERIHASYRRLHAMGVAHSVEAWRAGSLVGGLYGVRLGGAFFGESMFSRATDASKVCLVHLVRRLRMGGFLLLDTQWTTAHLRRFGAMDIPRYVYFQRLGEAIETKASWSAVDRKAEPDGREAAEDAGDDIGGGKNPVA